MAALLPSYFADEFIITPNSLQYDDYCHCTHYFSASSFPLPYTFGWELIRCRLQPLSLFSLMLIFAILCFRRYLFFGHIWYYTVGIHVSLSAFTHFLHFYRVPCKKPGLYHDCNESTRTPAAIPACHKIIRHRQYRHRYHFHDFPSDDDIATLLFITLFPHDSAEFPAWFAISFSWEIVVIFLSLRVLISR